MIVIAHNTDPVDRLEFAPVGSVLAVSHNYRWLGIWNLSERRLISSVLRDATYVRPEFRFHPTLPHVYYANEFGEIQWFDPIAPEGDALCKGTGWAENLVLTNDANRLLVCERGYCEFRLFDLTRGYDAQPVWTTPVYSRIIGVDRVSIELLPEDRFIVAETHLHTRGRIAVRSLATGELLATTRIPNHKIAGLALAPDGAHTTVMSEMSLFVYATEHLRAKPRKVMNDNRKHFTGIAFHPSGRYLAATSNDATVKLYDTTSWQLARTFTWDVGKMRSVAFSPDGTLAAAGSDTGKVVVWDVDV